MSESTTADAEALYAAQMSDGGAELRGRH